MALTRIKGSIDGVSDSVSVMRNADLTVGELVETKGYNTPGDGGAGKYLIAASQTVDGFGDHTLTNGNVALLQVDGTRNVKQFGAVGDGVSDDSAEIQAALDATFADGGALYIPRGIYNIVTALTVDRSGETGTPITNRKRVNIFGEGKGVSVLSAQTNSMNVLSITGDASGSTAAHGYFTLRDFSIVGETPTTRTANGLRLINLAYIDVENVTFHNLNTCMVLTGTLSSNFNNLIFNESVRGISANAGGFSAAHANYYSGCEFRFLTSQAYDGFTGTSQAVFVGCQFEACGTQGNAATGALIFRLNGAAGEVGPSFYGCYFEVNRGGFDVNVAETAATRVTCSFVACNFNRVGTANFVTNNIIATGSIDVNLSGCSFTGYGGYVPNAGRPYLNLASVCRFRDMGNRYQSATEAPTISQGLPYAGKVLGSLGSGVTGTLPNGWTVSRPSTGVFLVTHSLGHIEYSVTATAIAASPRSVQRIVQNTNNFQVVIANTADTLIDSNFCFNLVELMPDE